MDALKKACEKHSALTKDCSKAQGHDRHLYAIMSLWQREQNAGNAGDASVQTSLTRDDRSISTNGFSNQSSERDPNSVVSSPNRNSMVSDDGSIPPGGQSESPPRKGQHSVPAIFDDPGWEMLNNTILSTSNCGNPSLRHFGFGPTSGDGFGIGYIIKDSSVSICASSKHRQTKRYIDTLETYFIEMRKLLRQTQRKGANDKQASRAREVEDSRPKSQKSKNRGRVIGENVTSGKVPAEVDSGDASDDDLGGCKLTTLVDMEILLTCRFRWLL